VVSTFTLVGHTDTGRRKWEIEGETADLMSETVELSPVEATSFGKVRLHLTAEHGQFRKASQNIHLKGDVVVTTSDGAKLTTESLDWTAEQETGTTQDWVTVTRPGMTVVGLGGTGYPKLKQVRFEQDVTMTLDGEAETTVITCDGPMEVDYGRNRARFWENVAVKDSKGLIQADRMDVLMEAKTHQIQKTTFWGHVEIYQGDQVAKANRAIYWQPEGRIRLMGSPELVLASQEHSVE